MHPSLQDSYRAAEEIARTRARNFYYSFVVLPPEKRRALCAVYAFMRHCDDISDGCDDLESKRGRLHRLREHLDLAISGVFRDNPIFPAFHDSVRRFRIPAEYFHWVIDGAEMDLSITAYQTFDELYRYCFNVASAVGLVCIHIFGFKDGLAKQHAQHCGVAFQLTNILRDVREDAQMGRIYLPKEDLERFHYSPDDLRNGVFNERFLQLMAFEAGRAEQYYLQGRQLLPLVEESSRPSLWAMMEIYNSLLRKIIRRGYDVFGERIHLSRREKTTIVLRALYMRYFAPASSLSGSSEPV